MPKVTHATMVVHAKAHLTEAVVARQRAVTLIEKLDEIIAYGKEFQPGALKVRVTNVIALYPDCVECQGYKGV